jgi:hypothetical protein
MAPMIQELRNRYFPAACLAVLLACVSMCSAREGTAASKLKGASASEAITSQHQAGERLRYVLISYINEFLVVPAPAGPSDPAVTDPVESLGDDLTLYSPGAISGSKPKGGRQEWQVLGRRDRAALNENFARELPLEYRAILKDYYERLAR